MLFFHQSLILIKIYLYEFLLLNLLHIINIKLDFLVIFILIQNHRLILRFCLLGRLGIILMEMMGFDGMTMR
jgi:hypothetical protein